MLKLFLVNTQQQKRRWPWWVLAIAMAVAIIAVAGPVWQQMEQPLYRQQQALVIVLDLSRSMLAQDSKPDRLTRAKQKISDLLALRQEGQTALVAYAADAFAITPLSDDVRVIAQQLSSLHPDIMPAQGSRLDLALQQAWQLLKNGGVPHGDILVLSDSADRASKVASDLHHHGHRVSVWAFGSADGAPIPSTSGFITDNSGKIVVPRTDIAQLRQLAQAGGGWFAHASLGNQDMQQLAPAWSIHHDSNKNSTSHALGDQWHEEGVWLLLLLLPLAALSFRRGWLLMIVMIGAVASPHPASATTFSNLWRNQDQQAKQLLDQGDVQQAANTFSDRRWKAMAHYRAGEYQKAAQALADDHDADSLYNRGNALAKAKQWDQAIAAYDQALKKDPTMKDAAFNRNIVKNIQQQLKKKKQQQQQNHDDNNKRNHERKDNKQQQKGGDNHQKETKSGGKQNKSGSKQNHQPSSSNKPQPQKPKEAMKHQTAKSKKEKAKNSNEKEPTRASKPNPNTQLQQEKKQEQKQWLRRIPDDPGGLLRRKFQYQYRQRGEHRAESERW